MTLGILGVYSIPSQPEWLTERFGMAKTGTPKRKKSIVVKMSPELRSFVTQHSVWKESIDATIRRLLGRRFRKWLAVNGNNG